MPVIHQPDDTTAKNMYTFFQTILNLQKQIAMQCWTLVDFESLMR